MYVDVELMTEKEFLAYAKSKYFVERRAGDYTLEIRYSIVRQVMKVLGFTENKEQILYILCNKSRVITEACAGAGKTYISLVKIICHMMFGDIAPGKVIMLSYTRESCADLKNKFNSLYLKLKCIDMGPLKLSDNVVIKTIGSFYDELVYEYAEEYGIRIINKRLCALNDLESLMYLNEAMQALVNKQRLSFEPYDGLSRNLSSLYTQIKEKDIYDDKVNWIRCSSYKCVAQLPLEEIAKIFEVYEKLKRGRQVTDLVEYASFSSKIFENVNYLARWRRRFQMMFIDEYQDVTEAQTKVFRKMFDWEENPNSFLFAIGDGDQSIYGFRGAHANGCVNFHKDFKCSADEMAICYMTLNRRCPENIMDIGRKVIYSCNTRTDKQLKALKSGGTVTIQEVSGYEQEIKVVTDLISTMSERELSDTVICYRSTRSGRLMKWELESLGIQVKIKDDIKDIFRISLEGVLSMLDDPYDMPKAKLFLHRVLPKSRELVKKDIIDVINKEIESRERGNAVHSIFELDFSKYRCPKDFDGAIQMLKNFSMAMNEDFEMGDEVNHKYREAGIFSMSKIVSALVFKYLKKYYLMWQDQKNSTEGGEHIFNSESEVIEDAFCVRVYRWYTQDITWREMKIMNAKRAERLENTQKRINMSTFHSLKGLEYRNVILVDMRDSIFPGYELSEAALFGKEQINIADDEAKRLLYVAVTRSKSKLWILYNSKNPTRYLSLLNNDSDAMSLTSEFDFDSIEEQAEEVELTSINMDDLDSIELMQSESERQSDVYVNHSTILNRWLEE